MSWRRFQSGRLSSSYMRFINQQQVNRLLTFCLQRFVQPIGYEIRLPVLHVHRVNALSIGLMLWSNNAIITVLLCVSLQNKAVKFQHFYLFQSHVCKSCMRILYTNTLHFYTIISSLYFVFFFINVSLY